MGALNGLGTDEALWRASRFEDGLPRVGVEGIVPPGCRAVVVAPHPDDEVLGTGGLLAALAATDRAVLIVAVTDGEASHPGSARWTPETLAEARRAESREGLRCLGLASPEVQSLALPDSGVAAHETALGVRLQALLRPSDVVFVTWQMDGHPDHEAVARATAHACDAVGAQRWEVPVWMWNWSAPHDPRVPWARAVVLSLDDRVCAAKASAIRAHRSQLEDDPSGPSAILPAKVLDHFARPFEVFFRASLSSTAEGLP